MNVQLMRRSFTLASCCEAAVFSLIFLFFSGAFGSVTIDDAFISFRYAYNLIHHGIWNYNPDHAYVEAYTSALYTALAIIPIGLGIPPIIFFKVFGLALFLRFLWTAAHLCPDRLTRIVVLAFILLNPNVYVHFYGCLETPLFLVLCLEIYAILLRGSQTRWFYWLLLMLPLTRPEGAVISVIALGLYTLKHRAITNPRDLASVAVIAALYFAWRCWYFGYLLPNTFYAKAALSSAFSFLDNISIVLPYVALFVVLALSIRQWAYCGIIAAVALIYSIFYLSSNLLMNYADRFALQIFLPVIIAAAYYARKLSDQSRLVIVLLLPLLLISRISLPELFDDLTDESEKHYSIELIAHELAPFKDHNLTLMAADVGANAYYSGWKTYDMVGLANTTIAHKGNSMEYMRIIQPDLIFLFGVGKQWVWGGYRAEVVFNYIQESQDYELVGKIPLPGHREGYYLVFLKKSIPDYKALQTVVTNVAETAEQFHQRPMAERMCWKLDYFL